MQNKGIFIGILFLVIIAIGGGIFFLSSTKEKPKDNEEVSTNNTIPSLEPEDIGLEMIASANKKQVKFVIHKPDGIESIVYTLSYETGDGQIRGVDGTLESNGDTLESKFHDLGSCSRNVCKYDTGVTQVDLLLKVTKDRKVYSVEDFLTL